MKLISTNKLDNTTQKNIIDLVDICKQYDNINGCIFLEDDMNYLTDFPCYIYCTKEDSIIGFFSMFIPDDYNCEIYAYVHPDYRKNGVFKSMYTHALQLLKQTNICNLQIVCEPNSTGENILLSKGHTDPLCECMMRYDTSYIPVSYPDYLLVFSENETFAELVFNNIVLGHCRIDYSQDCTTIYNVEIYEQYQGNGYSKILMNLVLKRIKKSSVVLHVTASNTKALRAYTSCGFNIVEELHFYDISQLS